MFCFNPTLVRLRPWEQPFLRFFPSMFQSHAGSIEARPGRRPGDIIAVFQSHAGSIEAPAAGAGVQEDQMRFNPTLV